MYKTKFELMHGVKPDISHLRTFGCGVYAKAYNNTTKKWDPQAFKGRFVGIDDISPKAYRIYSNVSHRYIYTSSVKFDERSCGKEGKTSFDIAAQNEGLKNLFDDSEAPTTLLDSSTTSTSSSPQPTITNSIGNKRKRRTESQTLSSEAENLIHDMPTNVQQLTRKGRSSGSYGSTTSLLSDTLEHRALSAEEARITPNTIKQALESPDADMWLESIMKETMSLYENNTFTIMLRPQGIRALGLKYVFKIKERKDGSIERYKTRCTALGNLQKYGYDYLETFSPVVRYSTLRMLLAKAASEKLIMHHMDVDTAFLYGVLPEEDPAVYVSVPDYYPIPDNLKHLDKSLLVAKVNKAIYGLKQSPRLWNQNIDNNMQKLHFTKSQLDPCLYIKHKNGETLYVAIFVDDIVIAGTSPGVVTEFKNQLKSIYKCKDLGKLEYFLGMEINIDETSGNITISQKKYIHDILKRFGLLDCNPKSVPMDPGLVLPLSQDPTVGSTNHTYPYREVVGSLMYLMVTTRPDLSFSVGYLARYLNKFTKTHFAAAIQVLKYVKGTEDIGITYHSNVPCKLVGYSDADWASDINTRRSTTGYLFTLCGGAVS